MNIMEELNEKLREACCMGDSESVYKCLSQGADVNSKNQMNGWTCLHWASKRGHANLVEILLRSNANPNVFNDKQQTAFEVADLDSVKDILRDKISNGAGGSPFKPVECVENDARKETNNGVKFVPNYLSHPVFPYGVNQQKQTSHSSAFQPSVTSKQAPPRQQVISSGIIEEDELVLRVRYPQSEEMDFIEIEFEIKELTFDNLVKICKKELELGDDAIISKIRKLPNTIVRKDKDVKRLKPFQELEVITSGIPIEFSK